MEGGTVEQIGQALTGMVDIDRHSYLK